MKRHLGSLGRVAPQSRFIKGFGLVEMMVSVVIGMFAVMVMMQVLSNSESNKRASTGGNDAMIEGVTALYSLQRDIRMAGYGITDSRLMGCSLVLRAGVTIPSLAPATINMANITGQDTNTDTLMVIYGSSFASTQGDNITSAGSTQNSGMFSANDYVVEAPQSRSTAACSITLDTVLASSTTSVTLSGNSMTPNDTLFNLGQTLTVAVYAVRNGNLSRCDYVTNDCGSAANNASTSVWVPVGSNIVSLRAQYGRDTAAIGSMDGYVDIFDQSTPATSSVADACLWARISAIRYAIVARSPQYEKEVVTGATVTYVTTAAPLWDGTLSGNPTGSAATPIVLNANSTWQNYRYRVFQMVAPIRNSAWMGAVSGC